MPTSVQRIKRKEIGIEESKGIKRDMLQTLVNSDAETKSTYFLSKKIGLVSGTSSAKSNWVGYQVEENIGGESHE